MLVCTPLPQSTESLFGYILRVAETNGYDTPRYVLNHAGYGASEMRSAGLDTSRLAKVLGFLPYELKNIAFFDCDKKGKRVFKVLNHELGKQLPKPFLRLKTPMLCPQCVKEQGFIDVFWDLHFAIACPHHRCQLLKVCPVCKEDLHWLRPGLLRCKCGAHFHSDQLKPVDIAIVELMTILKEKLHGNLIVNLPNTMQYPIKEMENTSLFSFVWMLTKLGEFSLLSKGLKETKDPDQILLEASEVLSDWPSGYHKFLNQLGLKFKEERPSAIGLRKQFQKYYIAMFKCKSHPTEHVDFLRNEFISFGVNSWGMAIVNNGVLKNSDIATDGRFISKSKIADELCIAPGTLRNWIEKGLVPNKKVTFGKHPRYILDKQTVDLVNRREAGKTFNLREAAAYLDIPVSILMPLKKSGHYTVEHLPIYIEGFHEKDLNNFSQKLLAKAVFISKEKLNDDYISLDSVLHNKQFWSQKGKAYFLEAYLDGKVSSMGRTSDSIKDIFFHKIDVDNIISKCRMETSEKTLSQAEVAKLIGCRAVVVQALISSNVLIGIPGPNRIRVKYESANEFSKQYLSFSTLSVELNTTPKRLLTLCRKKGIDALCVKTKSGNITSFIKKDKVSILKYHIVRNPVGEVRRKVAVQNNVSSLMKVQYYLRHLRKKDMRLPRIGSKPNKRKIAKACRISTRVFYRDLEAVKLLEAFDAKEKERKRIINKDDIKCSKV